jgi:hypothetical protein
MSRDITRDKGLHSVARAGIALVINAAPRKTDGSDLEKPRIALPTGI